MMLSVELENSPEHAGTERVRITLGVAWHHRRALGLDR
jgi:hypothetical protein